jgi:hypothetical protein
MELVANVWPVIDEGTDIFIRYFMREYAIEGPDHVIRNATRTGAD